MKNNPFKYGSPVMGDDFLDRERITPIILMRLLNGESSTIFGDPHVGKTSFLWHIANPSTQLKYPEFIDTNISKNWVFSYLNGQSLQSLTRKEFWDSALLPLIKANQKNLTIARSIKQAQKSNYYFQDMYSLFEQVKNQGQLLILLIDEIENLFQGKDFQDPSFWGLLRDVCSVYGGIACVFSSRYSHSELDKIGVNVDNLGSPYINFAPQNRLLPFDDLAIDELLQKASPSFSEDQKSFIKRVSGQNPYVLQFAANLVYNSKTRDEMINDFEKHFHESLDGHFDNVWKHLKDQERTVAVILAVRALEGRVLGTNFNYGEIERTDIFGPELRRLEKKGLARLVNKSELGWSFDAREFLVWRGEEWALSCDAFAWWVRDTVITESRSVYLVGDWLYNKKYKGLITQEQWDEVTKTIQNLAPYLMKGAGALIGALWDGIQGKKT